MHRVRREGDYGSVIPGALVQIANALQRLEPAHVGHLDVHQHDVDTAAPHRRQSLLAVSRLYHLMTMLL